MTGPRIALAAIAVAAVGVFLDGGYSAEARVLFGTAAVAAALVVGRGAPVREPVVVVLLALAALGALSALWTLGPVDRTLRWALVTIGYAGVFVTAAAGARRRGGVEALATGLAIVAVVAGLAGLIAAVTFSTPYAERIAGVWRPGGPFEYPPALALLVVSALPALVHAMTARARVPAAAGAVGMAVAGGVLALSASRVGLAMAVAVGGIALARAGVAEWPRRTVVAAALGLGAAAGIALQLAAGGPAIGMTSDPARAAALIATLALAGPVWLAARGLLDSAARPGRADLRSSPPRLGTVHVAAAVVLAAVVAGSLAFGIEAGRGGGASGGFLHGRDSTWGAALHTFADRPLIGTGADAFLAGSAQHQGGQTIAFAHSLPLELAAELGIAGLALALALYVATGRLIWRARTTLAGSLMGPPAAAFLVAGLVDWPWHLAGAGAAWALSAGGLAGAIARSNRCAPRGHASARAADDSARIDR
jgi:O-antigen ligase